MKVHRATLGCVAVGLLVCSLSAPVWAQAAQVRTVDQAASVFQAIVAMQDRAVPDALLRQATAIAIIPNVRRIGFVIGGQSGRGVLLVRSDNGSWGRPLFVLMRGASVGWQIGIQSADVVLFFRTRQSVNGVLQGGFTLGVNASVAAGGLGREAAAATDESLQAEIYSYSRTRGLFAGVSVEGATLDVDYNANSAFYGKQIESAAEVTAGDGLPDPPSAIRLQQALAHGFTEGIDFRPENPYHNG